MQIGFGIDLGGTTVKLACFNTDGDLLDKWEIPTDKTGNGRNILPDIARSMREYVTSNKIDPDTLVGAGIGVPGPVRPDGSVNGCVNLGWGEKNIEKELSALTGLPVKAGNDATVAALGECWKGSGQGCQNMVLATLGTGIGGGVVIGGRVISVIVDGKPVQGVHGAGGEIGHMVLNRSETEVCGCGKRGCVEQYCSATGIVRIAKQVLSDSREKSALRDIPDLTAKDVFDAAKNGDSLAAEILEQVYCYMGEFVANICCVTDPEKVVFGGGVSKAGEVLLAGVARHYRKYAFHGCADVEFSLATLGNDAGAYGAFKLILGEV